MRRLVVASALGLALLAMAGTGGTASAMPLGVQESVAAATGADLLVPVQYRRPYGHQYRRSYYVHQRHYAPPPRYYRHGWRR